MLLVPRRRRIRIPRTPNPVPLDAMPQSAWSVVVTACLLVAALAVMPTVAKAQRSRLAQYAQARERLVREVILRSGIEDKRVVESIRTTQRHEFVPFDQRKNAYYDMALPIGEQQTISSPFIVAFMTQSLDPQPTDKVLEIGTGSGYQAAVLSPLVDSVYSIEIVESLGNRAAETLKRLGYRNVHVKVGDGYKGWPEHAPFDKMIITCSPETVPQPLIDQLREGGMIVVPVGERYQQMLYLFTKVDGKLKPKALRPTLFVPMTGAAEEKRQVQPDPLHPKLVNPSFEEDLGEDEHVPGWYYQRQVKLVDDQLAPNGKRYVRFENHEQGRGAHIMQGFGVDGRKVAGLTLSGWVKTDGVVYGRDRSEVPKIGLILYDEKRAELGRWWLGPWQGSSVWHHESTKIRVPEDAREGIVSIGLFGATGVMQCDDVQIERKE